MTPTWDIAWAIEQEWIDKLLTEGWEPYAVTLLKGNMMYHFRRPTRQRKDAATSNPGSSGDSASSSPNTPSGATPSRSKKTCSRTPAIGDSTEGIVDL